MKIQIRNTPPPTVESEETLEFWLEYDEDGYIDLKCTDGMDTQTLAFVADDGSFSLVLLSSTKLLSVPRQSNGYWEVG